MKRTLLAFLLAPLVPATIYGLACAVNVMVHRDEIGGSAPEFGGFLVGFIFGGVVASVIAWTLGVLVFLGLSSAKKEGWISYSIAGLLLGAAYAYFTKQERGGGDLLLYFSAFCIFGVSASAAFWAVRRTRPNRVAGSINSPGPHTTARTGSSSARGSGETQP